MANLSVSFGARTLPTLVVFVLVQLVVVILIVNISCKETNKNINVNQKVFGSVQCKNENKNIEERDLNSIPEWEKSLDFTGFNNETGTLDGRYIVPNYIHFVKFGENVFEFLETICILAALKHQKPEKLFIHSDVVEFEGKYWRTLLSTPGFKEVLVINKMDLPTHTMFGSPLNSEWVKYHGGDVAKIMILKKYGGIYLDKDSYVIRSMDDLRRYEFVASWRPEKAMMNQVVLTHKDARLLKEWEDGYRDYKADMWFYNAGRHPANVLLRRPELIHTVPELLGTYDIRSKLYLKVWPAWRTYYSCHTMARWMNNYKGKVQYSSPMQEEDVVKYNNTFQEMVRDVYDLGKLKGS